MIDFLKKGSLFIKANPNILYSLLLIIVIPFALYFNTAYTAGVFQRNVDFIMQTNAMLTESVLGVLVSEDISSPDVLRKKVAQIAEENPEISQLRIAVPDENEQFKISISIKEGETGLEMKGDPVLLAWSKNQAIAYLVADEKGERFWEVVKPISDADGNKTALISMAFSLKSVDELLVAAVRRSYMIVFGAVILTLFLIIQHTRLFKYPILLRRLQEIDKMKDDFIRMAIHELQSPIVNLRNYALGLKEMLSSSINEEQGVYLSRVVVSAERLTALIEDMLNVSRIEQERVSFTLQPVMPMEVIKEVINELKLKAGAKKLEIAFMERGEGCLIAANPHRLKEILYNLIDNSIKYTFQGKIEVATLVDKPRKKYYIVVQDTGLGMSAEAQKRLFEKFYRIKTRETADVSGTGLGLWIARELARKMNGDILVESMEKHGSKFILVFPIAK